MSTSNDGEPDPTSAERAALRAFLDDQRAALIARVEGLSEADARATPTVSSLSLLGLIRHSAIWERRWFQVIVAGTTFEGEWPEVDAPGEDSTFVVGATETIASVVADFREQIAASNEILRTFDLDAPCRWAGMANESVRWVALHLIEETARHAGHADIIRESIDGTRGR